jgi:hypothetical protein
MISLVALTRYSSAWEGKIPVEWATASGSSPESSGRLCLIGALSVLAERLNKSSAAFPNIELVVLDMSA